MFPVLSLPLVLTILFVILTTSILSMFGSLPFPVSGFSGVVVIRQMFLIGPIALAVPGALVMIASVPVLVLSVP